MTNNLEYLVISLVLSFVVGLLGTGINLDFDHNGKLSMARSIAKSIEMLTEEYRVYESPDANRKSYLGALTPKYMKELPLDPWGNEYKMVREGRRVVPYSMGSNLNDDNGRSDDITASTKLTCEEHRYLCRADALLGGAIAGVFVFLVIYLIPFCAAALFRAVKRRVH